MQVKTSLGVILAVAIGAAGCDSRPTAEIDAARASLERAASNAGTYAADSLQAAREAATALEAELSAQDAKWWKSYDRARDLAASAVAAGEKAVTDAGAERERVEARAKAAAEARARLASTAVRPGGAIKTPVKVKNVAPQYPEVARSARVGGTVQIEATIGPDGKVADTKVVKSSPLLDQAALDAVRQWEYQPTRVKGVAVPVIINVAVTFQP